MKRYIGVKIIHAEPATNVEAAAIQNGCSVEAQRELYKKNRLPEKDGYRVKYPDGYESWSPKTVFEEAYRECDCMTFGLAIEAMKKGHKVARKGWNGKEMFLYYVPANRYTALTDAAKEIAGDDGKVEYTAYVAIKTVQGNVCPWLASQADVLGEDWYIVE